MKNELPNYNKKVGGYVVFNKDGKTAITNDGTKGGYFYGDSHQDPSNGISAIVDNDRPILVEGSEVIINKKTVQSEKVLTVKGTPKEILSTLNQMDGNGVAIGDEEAEILAKYRTGGSIPREKQIYLGKEGGSNVSPKGMFESAVQMENEGIDSETIRSITGWFRSDLDGLWRYEISDNEMEIICTFTDKEINHLKTKNNYIQRYLKDVIKHEELFKAYPRIKYLKVLFVDSNNSDVALLDVSNEGVMFIICNLKYEREISDSRGGTKELGEREISDNRRSGEERKAKRYNTLHFRKVITHELQHAIQINEGLAEGGNPNIELKKLKTNSGAIQSLTEKEQEYIATQRYLNKAGEIEAMSSDARIDYNDLQRIRNKPYSEIAIDPKYFSSDLETKIKFREGGELIKRADGSYSRRGLWDNIRDNVGSGRKPTKQMLEQEAKIRAKYHLGGDMSKHLAPNGKPSKLNHEQWHLVRTPEFKAWFGDWENEPENASKVIDKETKEPLMVYHGTSKEFTVFSLEKVGSNVDYGMWGSGFYFSPLKSFSKNYGSKLLKLFLNIRNPFVRNSSIQGSKSQFKPVYGKDESIELRNKIINSNYDGVLQFESGEKNPLTQIVAFEPNQIKLADGSNTTFDGSNDDIRFAEGGGVNKGEFIIEELDEDSKQTYQILASKNIGGADFFFSRLNIYPLQNVFTIELPNGEEIGRATLNEKENYLTNIRVNDNYRRKGLALNLYNFIEYVIGKKLKPSPDKISTEAKGLWAKRNTDIRFAEGGSISNMTPSELKEFYDSPEGKKLDAQTYSEWNKLVNMSKSELEKFYNSVEGKEAGLSPEEAKEQGIDSGRESARWIMKMKDIPYTKWSSDMWRWAKKQINFIKRMSGMKGSLYNDKGEKTRKHTALLIWGHNPEQKFKGGGDIKAYDNFKNPILINGFISNKKIDGKEIFLITYNSGGQEGLNVHQTMNPLAMLDAVEKKTGLHTNTLQVFIYEHTENSNRIETEDELEFLRDNYTVIIVDRDSVEFYNGHNPEQKFAQGGGIEDEFELEIYQVRFDTDDDSEIKLVTTSYEDAKYRYDSTTMGDFGDSEFSVSLEKKIDKYKFIYELDEDESIEDYPIEEYYDDSYYYELTEEGEFDNIENRVVESYNYTSNDLLNDVENWAKNKFGNYKYNRIDVYSEDDTKEENDSIGSIQLRIADHSQNESNLPYGIDRSLSVVIANKDATRGRFQQNRPQIYFDGNDSFDYVISEIENYIEDAKEDIQSKKFEKGGRLRKFRGGGELSQKALAVETNDLTDFVRKYFIKDGRIDVSDAMQELFGNKRGKSIADEYRKRIGLHKKGGLTISQLAHNLWEQHRDEVREDIDDSDFRNAVEEVLISEYGVSSMIKSLMEKSEGNEQDRENEYWMNQFDEGDDEYYEDLSDEEVADYFKDMEGFERELAKGTEHEMEHLETLKKVAEGKITPEQAVVQTAKTHIKENPEYYEDLQKMELENEESIPDLIEGLKVLAESLEGAEKKEIEDVIEGLEILLESDSKFDRGGGVDENTPKVKLATINKIKKLANRIMEIYYLNLGDEDDIYSYSGDLSFKERRKLFEETKKLEAQLTEITDELSKSQCESIDNENFQALNAGGDFGYEDEDEDEYAEGGSIGSVLWATKIGEPDYNEQLITENSSEIENAKKWALANGFDRLRVLTIDNSKPDFTKGFKKYAEGGELDKNSMIFEPSKSEQDEEKRIMENQFGKNI